MVSVGVKHSVVPTVQHNGNWFKSPDFEDVQDERFPELHKNSSSNHQIFPIAFYYKTAPIVLFVVLTARDMTCHHLLCSLLCYVALKAAQCACVRVC